MSNKKNFAPFEIKCNECKNKMRYSRVSMVKFEFKYTCDKCEYTIKILRDWQVTRDEAKDALYVFISELASYFMEMHKC